MGGGFWLDVLSNLIATIIGVALGIPTAQWLQGRSERGQRRADAARVRDAIGVLIECIQKNVRGLDSAREHLARGDRVFGTHVDLDTWESVRPTITTLVKNPTVYASCADLFARFRLTATLLDRHLDMVIANSTAWNPPAALQATQRNLTSAREELLAAIPEICRLAERTVETLTPLAANEGHVDLRGE